MVGLKEGDHAGVAWLHDACGRCEYCMTGWDSLCYAQHNTGYSVNGSFAEYVIGAPNILAAYLFYSGHTFHSVVPISMP